MRLKFAKVIVLYGNCCGEIQVCYCKNKYLFAEDLFRYYPLLDILGNYCDKFDHLRDWTLIYEKYLKKIQKLNFLLQLNFTIDISVALFQDSNNFNGMFFAFFFTY